MHTCTCIHTYIHHICICIHTCMHTYTHTYIHIHTYVHTYICVHMYIHSCTHKPTYIHTDTHEYVNIIIYIHTYVHTYNSSGPCSGRCCSCSTLPTWVSLLPVSAYHPTSTLMTLSFTRGDLHQQLHTSGLEWSLVLSGWPNGCMRSNRM